MTSHTGVQEDDGTFQRPDLDDIVERKETVAKDHFGADVDLSQGSPVKQIIDVVASEHDHIWQTLEEVYYSAYFEHAYEDQLNKLLAIASITRKRRRGATGVVTFSTNIANDENTIIPEGTRVTTQETDDRPQIPFRTEEPATLPAGAHEVSDVPIRALEPWETDLSEEWLGGTTNVAANTITEFETPVNRVENVTNPYPTGQASREEGYSFIQGRDRETDAELRDRFRQQYGHSAHATLDGIRANLLDVNGILNAGMEENVSMDNNTGSGGLPPKSFRATVFGDAPDDTIAQAIFDKRPAGIQSYGETSGTAYSNTQETFSERWDWADEVHIHVSVELKHNDDYPADGNLEVENRLVREIGGETAGGTQYTGLGMGDDVIYDILHSIVMAVPGVWTADVRIGTDDANLGTDDITVFSNETAMTHVDSIDVFNTLEERG